jgi:hypothetical protein
MKNPITPEGAASAQNPLPPVPTQAFGEALALLRALRH